MNESAFLTSIAVMDLLFVADLEHCISCHIDMSFTLLNDNTDSDDKKSQITTAIYAADQLLLEWQNKTDLLQQLHKQVFRVYWHWLR